jgi:biotin carboxyl carrier protein
VGSNPQHFVTDQTDPTHPTRPPDQTDQTDPTHPTHQTMKFELQVGDRLRTVEIQRRADGFHVVVDGRVRLVDAAHLGQASWSLLVRDADGGSSRSVEATVLPQKGNGGVDVHLDGFTIPVELKGRARQGRAMGGGTQGAGPQRVTAPMPGKVVRVLVKAGDEVTARQGLVVVEAMKMENELRAARDGRVREVLVSEGQSVDAGSPLMVVE